MYKRQLRILMLEDIEEESEMIVWTLKKAGMNMVTRRVETKEGFLASLREFRPDIILSDHSLPQFNSTQAFRISRKETPDIPFILVTGRVSEEFAAESIKQGMDDYILKSNLTRLPTAIEHAMREKYLKKRKKEAERAISRQNENLLKINRELDSFVYSISHNLKSPLASVKGLINLMRIESLNDPHIYYDMLNRMEKSIDKLNLTLSDILDHSKNSRTGVIPELINLEDLVNSSYKDMDTVPAHNEIEFKVSLLSENPFYSDRYRLEVIIQNLLSNSIKYSDKGKQKPYIHVTCKVDVNKAHITIYDNGIGIPDDQMPRIFDMFTRCTEAGEGSGLGLYIVKEMIERLKGNLQVSSEVSVGTSIAITLPNLNEKYEIPEKPDWMTVSLAVMLFPVITAMESILASPVII